MLAVFQKAQRWLPKWSVHDLTNGLWRSDNETSEVSKGEAKQIRKAEWALKNMVPF
jgi:hypothetical protein